MVVINMVVLIYIVFQCQCGSRMVDNKTSVTYHLANVCKSISNADRSNFTESLSQIKQQFPPPQKREVVWKQLCQKYGEFSKINNKKVYTCFCGERTGYKKMEAVPHLADCETVSKDDKDILITVIKSNISNIRGREKEAMKSDMLSSSSLSEIVGSMKLANGPIVTQSSKFQNPVKLVLPRPKHDYLMSSIRHNSRSIDQRLLMEEKRLERTIMIAQKIETALYSK
eukprot:NODE_316_length_9983_cov_1.089741.p6 type:complete len:227 gc:universal NODE_316_length_9983_cov_1.089741:8470-7790(-)